VSEVSIQDLMDRLPQAFQPEMAGGTAATVLFQLSGEGGGEWVVTIARQQCVVEKGSTTNPNLVFTASAQDCLDIFNGKLDGMSAFMRGKLRLQGDMSLAMKLAGFFKV